MCFLRFCKSRLECMACLLVTRAQYPPGNDKSSVAFRFLIVVKTFETPSKHIQTPLCPACSRPLAFPAFSISLALTPSPLHISPSDSCLLASAQASKSRAARQGLLGDTGDGAVRETILPPIDSVTRQARSARATVPQGARQQRRAAYSARLGKLGIENPVSEEF